ncbi:murein biosynthesis integral membrane protein MurJ [Rhodospirillum rubrum]|uniref:Probable lipid II flippase MurJ n=1 Tax=Rhodospirillum rubrum (strain ATCC 11170 / ATH 1.1.1 / DSM 467 / LMG 4362 / NCIMB 8255 / S1) TaxID=269796 RepID=Q2RNG3_RHORT|nr:murein biosynthesis integral membrane protein MurJ [Rhodospirillum rubrum]ABC24332.1 Virulence factor MVIN-like [Rhodospirillum rubrum ATCC 11170]AEO50083.1 virulence factor MVIN-like protein [Rhodospirillum rubrum F11]MBK5956050.1 lipid II flippase MurJ [Rhodospirillum rubrum]QXG80259.1 murein biosynthesis integral membrane protein MurJ [Rhodospirillum rubrum]HAQ00235.1 murein biosynthesis integral membrane protein MurJ [Rhodospirillum rubrum]
MSLLRSISTVGGYTLLSRITGFVRDILIARYLGAGTLSDAFFVAFRFPNLFRQMFAEGAFTAAFVPIFAGVSETEGREAAHRFAEQAYTVLALILVVLVAGMEVVMPWAMYVLAPGFDDIAGKMELTTELSRLAFPYLFFISLTALQAGVLNSMGRFAVAAAAPILLNLTQIVALLGFADLGETPGHVLAWSVSLAGVLQFLWLYVHCRRAGMPIHFTRPRLSPKVRQLGRRVLPVVFGSGLYQVNLLVGTVLASMVSDGALSYLYYADRLTQLPLGVVGVAVGTVLLPLLSRQIKAGNEEAARWNQNRALEFSLLLTLPAAAALIAIAHPIITVLFERGAFTASDSHATSQAMIAFAAGLPAYVLIKVFSPAFYARDDTATPVKVAAASMLTNIVLNLSLIWTLGYLGIAIGAALSSWMNALLLGVILHRRGKLNLDQRMISRLPRMVLATAAMVGVLLVLAARFDGPLADGQVLRSLTLAGIVVAGATTYGLAVFLFRAARIADFRGMGRR